MVGDHDARTRHSNAHPDFCHRDLAWSLVQSPSLWALALSQGRDFISFLQSFRAMRRGYADGTFRYAVMVFQKQ